MKKTILIIVIFIISFSCFSQTAKDYFNNGIKKEKEKDFKNAIYEYTNAIEIKPNFTEAYFRRAILKFKLELYDEAIIDFCTLIELNPKNSKAYYYRGLICVKLEDYLGAIEDFNIAVKLNPNYKEAIKNRIIAKKKLKNINKPINLTQNTILNKNEIQSTNVLDNKNGFQLFKFGDSFNKWSPQLTKANVIAPNAYDYNGHCCSKILDFDVESIRLRFDQNKLVEIVIFIKEEFYETRPNDVYLRYYENAFVSNFERYTAMEEIKDKENKFDNWIYQWQGDKVVMQLSVYYGAYWKSSMKAIVRLYDKKDYYSNKHIDNF